MRTRGRRGAWEWKGDSGKHREFVTFYRFYGGWLSSGKSLPYTFAALLGAIYPFYLCSDGEMDEALWYLLTSIKHICCEISQGTG